MSTSVLILSGGLDSSVSAFCAGSICPPRLALYFDYGQRARIPERKAAEAIAGRLKVPFKVIEIPWLGALGQSALTHADRDLPRLAGDQLDDTDETRASAQAVWVPNRNGVFLNIAAAHAESLGCEWVVTGFNAEEAVTFPDNSAAFVVAADQFFSFATLNHVRVVSYTQDWDKTMIVSKGMELDVPFDLIWSCYAAQSKQCGECESCLRSARAYQSAGIWEQVRGSFLCKSN